MEKGFIEFKTCPGCGSAKLKIVVSGPSKDPMWVRCSKCGCDGPKRLTENGAIKAWNKRVCEIEIFHMKKPIPIPIY